MDILGDYTMPDTAFAKFLDENTQNQE